MNWYDIVYSILLSIIASFIFWLFTFKFSFTKVIFSKKLVKPNDTLTDNRKNYGYRVRYANVGHRDLMEVSIYAKLVINGVNRNHIFFLDVSNSGKQGFITVLSGFTRRKKKQGSFCRTMTLYPSESMQHELSKKKYPKKIRKLAKKGKVQFKDLFDEYGENISIIIYVYGNDMTTGSRKMFESQKYTLHDIEEGDFYGVKEIKIPIFSSIKTKQDRLSQIHRKICI